MHPKKSKRSFEELITNYYGRSRGDTINNSERMRGLFLGYYGQAADQRDKEERVPRQSVVLSCNYNDDDSIFQYPREKYSEEYVIHEAMSDPADHKYIVESPSRPHVEMFCGKNIPQEEPVSVAQEYEVDILQPLDNTVSLDCEMTPEKSSFPVGVQENQRPISSSFTDDDFAADMESISSGQKVVDASPKNEDRDHNRHQQQSAKNQSAVPAYETRDRHEIFDRIAKSMEYANTYDLGTIDLQNRFEDFDRLYEIQERAKQNKPSNQNTTSDSTPKPKAEWSEKEFIQDLDAIAQSRLAPSQETPDREDARPLAEEISQSLPPVQEQDPISKETTENG